MATNSFGPQEVNLQIQPLPTYIDADGAFKINTPMLSTYNFDGLIPKKQEAISVTLVKPGYLIQINPGEDYYPVVSVEKDDTDLESTGLITFNYINSLGNTVSTEFDDTDTVEAIYEDWSEKVLGSQGWGITAGGNAIFTNVAVRGRIEAEEGYISGTLTIGSGGSTTLNDVATTADLSGYIPDGSAAADIISNSTTITGGNIFTGTIQSQYYSYTSGLYSNNGMQVGLDGNGYIRSPNFYLDTSGNAYFRGEVNAAAGFFGTTAANWKIGSVTNGNRMAIETDTLKLYTQTASGVDHGNISFYSSNGSTFTGTIANALSQTDKTIQGLGNGLFIGTVDDYIFIPGSGNSNRARTKTSGFEWYASDGTTKIMSITGGAGGLSVFTGDITLTGGGTFIGDGSGLTNLPGGGGSYTLTNSDIIALPAVPNNSTGAKVLYGRILSSVPADASSYPDNSIVIIT